MASTPRAQTFSGRRVQLDRAPLARPRVPERPGSPRCRSGSSRPGRCNVFDSGAAHECRLEDAEAYDFFETFPKVSAEGMASIAIESNVCLDWNRLTHSLSLSLSRSLARAPHAQRTTQSPSADKVAETEAATSSRAVHASFTVQDTVSKTVSRSQRYLPHGGLGLCIVVCWAFLANDRKAEVKRRAEREKQAVLDEKKTWLK